ncbi:MAG: SDR family NAD(P)-dependent oxidoreductase [Acidimicrobiales bacterium]
MSVAIVTGASKGLGQVLVLALAERGWSLVIDARGEDSLEQTRRAVVQRLVPGARVVAIAGDVSDASHRQRIVEAAKDLGDVELLVNNASTLGPVPMKQLSAFDLDDLRLVYEVNTFAPLALVASALPLLASSANPRVIDITSDASVEAYEGWGGYGSSKAALDHLGAVLAAEEPAVRVWTVDPGDMRTDMHQDAFPGEDISDRPLPESVVPAFIELIEGDLPSGRYRARNLDGATAEVRDGSSEGADASPEGAGRQ